MVTNRFLVLSRHPARSQIRASVTIYLKDTEAEGLESEVRRVAIALFMRTYDVRRERAYQFIIPPVQHMEHDILHLVGPLNLPTR